VLALDVSWLVLHRRGHPGIGASCVEDAPLRLPMLAGAHIQSSNVCEVIVIFQQHFGLGRDNAKLCSLIYAWLYHFILFSPNAQPIVSLILTSAFWNIFVFKLQTLHA